MGILLAAGGCGSDEPKIPLYPASGQVLVGDQPASGVQVRFFDAANPTNPDSPHPFATTNEEGRFYLGTFEAEDGAPVGQYSVMLLWPAGDPGPGVPVDRFGNVYTNPAKSPFKASLVEGGTKLDPFRIDPSKVKPAQR